jgi:hypothetical protein
MDRVPGYFFCRSKTLGRPSVPVNNMVYVGR